MSNSITITVEDLPPMTVEQAECLRRKLKSAARETVKDFVLNPPIADDEVLARILADPVAIREFQRPDGIIVIPEGGPIPSAETLNKARGVILERTVSREGVEKHADGGGFTLWGEKPVAPALAQRLPGDEDGLLETEIVAGKRLVKGSKIRPVDGLWPIERVSIPELAALMQECFDGRHPSQVGAAEQERWIAAMSRVLDVLAAEDNVRLYP